MCVREHQGRKRAARIQAIDHGRGNCGLLPLPLPRSTITTPSPPPTTSHHDTLTTSHHLPPRHPHHLPPPPTAQVSSTMFVEDGAGNVVSAAGLSKSPATVTCPRPQPGASVAHQSVRDFP